MKKVLIADGGATKTDWLYVEGEVQKMYRTEGLHPSFIDPVRDANELKAKLPKVQPDQVYFYGTGIGNRASDEKMHAFLMKVFPSSKNIVVKSDLEGSAKAFFGDGDGAVAILGTGSICAKVESGTLVRKSAALGFAIGDEGSAADLGRRILKGYYRNQFSESTTDFLQRNLNPENYGDMMVRIYQAEKSNRELAAIAGEILDQSIPDELNSLIRKAFQDFAKQQLSMLKLDGDEKIIFTGKVAKAHQKTLIDVMKTEGFSTIEVKYPMIEYFSVRMKTESVKFW